MEPVKRPETGIFLRCDRPFGREIIRDPGRRLEFDVFESIVSGVEDRIENDIKGMEVPSDDRPQFGGKFLGVPILCVVAEFKVRAVKKVRSAACGETKRARTFAASNVRPWFLETL